MHLRHILISTALLAACNPKTADTGDDSGSSAADTGGAESTSATASGSTTGDSPTGAPPTTSGATDDSATSTGTSPSTSTSDTGNDDTGGASLLEACTTACMHLDECSPGTVGPVDQCIEDCNDNPSGSSECDDALVGEALCIAALSCEQVELLVKGEGMFCSAEGQATELACADLDCGGEVGGDVQACEFQQVCGDNTQAIICDGETCNCEENGVPSGQCPAGDFCVLGPVERQEAITACCGWEWTP